MDGLSEIYWIFSNECSSRRGISANLLDFSNER
ncbi:hypothetical protein DJ90_3455 [Paenibacillus macerans]|uniref:Uncharacterized protein n=1 Tax=Paenibacillus macerans TaxID=44252 RepID=A0A090ZA26_PAEMA|nr:hypothetical protein DJ90_3455 [Paenibacillus macerans]